MQLAPLQSKTANAAIVEDAGTNQFQILHMANIKELHHAGRTNASGVSQLDIEYHHNQWCLDNGYPVTRYKPQAGRPKASSAKLQKFPATSGKPQAASGKLQATSIKLQDI